MPEAKIFLTGAAGFVGERLVQRLVERGCRVRAFTRRDMLPSPPGFDARQRRPMASRRRGVGPRRHHQPRFAPSRHGRVRPGLSFGRLRQELGARPADFFRANVQGMRNVFSVAKEMGVRRVVWTSTCVTLGPTPRGTTGDENMPRSTARYFTEYEETKSIAEKEVLQMAAEGLPVVIVNPTRVYGPGNLTEGNSVTRLIDDYDRGRVPFLLNRGRNIGNWVLVDDVVEGHLLAMERGRIGERYLLGGENACAPRLLPRNRRSKRQAALPTALAGLHPLAVRLDSSAAG